MLTNIILPTNTIVAPIRPEQRKNSGLRSVVIFKGLRSFSFFLLVVASKGKGRRRNFSTKPASFSLYKTLSISGNQGQ